MNDLFGHALGAVVSTDGQVAFLLSDGRVDLRASSGKAIPLATPPGKGVTDLAFTPSARHLVGLRSGRLFTWDVPAGPPAR